MALPAAVTIREVVTRDGFQSWPEMIPTVTKIKVIEAAAAAGVKAFETTSLVSPRAVPQMADAADVLRGVPRQGLVHGALVPNLKGAELAAAAGADELNVVVSASESHNIANFRRTIDESLAGLEPIFQLAKDHDKPVIGAVAVAFGCPYEGVVPVENVVRLAQIFVDFGAKVIGLGDTTGMATPLRIKRMVGAVKDHFPDLPVLLHLHNNRGAAMANLYAGLEAGADMFDTALGGIGGCPNVPQASGNLATEDVVCMLEDMGIDTGIDLEAILDAAHFLQLSLGTVLPGQVLKSGPIYPVKSVDACGVK